MTASLHLARFSAPGTARMLRTMALRRRALTATPGLAAVRLCANAEIETVFGGIPRLRRWGLFCAWEHPEAREAFLAGGGLEPFQDGAQETWSVSLDTVRVTTGDWHGWRPSTEQAEPLRPDEPVAVITYGRVRPRYLPAFHRDNLRIVRELAPNPGLVMMTGLADHPNVRATFSVWRDRGSMVRFSYGPGLHNPIQRHALDVPWARNWFFARFRPVASSGTWLGRDPLSS